MEGETKDPFVAGDERVLRPSRAETSLGVARLRDGPHLGTLVAAVVSAYPDESM